MPEDKKVTEMTVGDVLEAFARWLLAPSSKEKSPDERPPIDTAGEPVAGDDAGKPGE